MTAIRPALVAAAAAILVTLSCSPPPPPRATTSAAADFVTLDEQAQRRAGIAIGSVETVRRENETAAPAVLALDEGRTARIGSLVQGIVLSTIADVGSRVRGSQVLATMHSPVVHEAWASYRKAIAERRRFEQELAYAVSAHERARRLYADKAVSLQDVQRAEADRVAAEEALDVGRTEVRRSEEEMQHLGITNADDPTGESGELIPVTTPISGVVLDRFVTPGTTVTPGSPLYVVSDLSALWALVEIDEALLSHVHAGQRISLRLAAYPRETFEGAVTLVGDTVNPKTRRVTLRCAVENRDGRLKPHMYATAIIREGTPHEAIVVPDGAVQTINGRPTVFIAEPGGRFRPRTVETSPAVDGTIEIRSGLSVGERIAIAGSFVLKSALLKPASED
jgi:cobalt-zinc-cadmium efflux system membrane fusion protein